MRVPGQGWDGSSSWEGIWGKVAAQGERLDRSLRLLWGHTPNLLLTPCLPLPSHQPPHPHLTSSFRDLGVWSPGT